MVAGRRARRRAGPRPTGAGSASASAPEAAARLAADLRAGVRRSATGQVVDQRGAEGGVARRLRAIPSPSPWR